VTVGSVFADGATRSEQKTPVFVLHHDNHLTCINYLPLQEALRAEGFASCCLERPGFGLSPAPVLNPEQANLKAETMMLVEALVQVVGEEHTFVPVGHGAGASFAWGAVRLAPKLHKGLILLDGVTQQALRSCPELNRFYARKPTAVQQALQLTGLRRVMAHFDSSGLWLPSGVPAEAVALHRSLQLTDKMFTSSATAFFNTPVIANQLHVITEAIPGAYISSDSQRSKKEGFPFMECANDASSKFVQRYFKKNLVLAAGDAGHFTMSAEAGPQLIEAAKFILESQ
jgi:pimeloyl-ACP methyl ester carboxylesterase